MNSFLEKNVFTRRKKNYHWQESLKNVEKKWFPLARKSVVHLQEKALKTMFQLKEKMPSLATVDCCQEIGKNSFHWPDSQLSSLSTFFENCFSKIPVMVSTSRNLTLIKKHCFH